MRNVRDEVFLHLIQLAKALRHHVEVMGEFGELIVAACRQAMPKLSFSDSASSLNQTPERLVDGTNEEQCHNNTERKRQQTGNLRNVFRLSSDLGRRCY